MKVHHSEHENKGWISVDDQLPDIGVWVRCACINIIDWGHESLEWECDGRIRKFPSNSNEAGKSIWTRRALDYVGKKPINLGQVVTHWKYKE